MDVCQIKIPGSISGDALSTQCHESELFFTARMFVEVTFAFMTWQPGLRLQGTTTACNSGFWWVNREADWPFAVSLEEF